MDFSLDILGCGSATPTMRHLPSCQVVTHRRRLMMIDCGEGAQLQMRRQRLQFSRLRHIFISHIHGDHFLGLPGLLSTMALHDTGGTVTVHCLRQGAELLRSIMAVLCRDTSFDIEYDVIEPREAVIIDDDALRVSTFPLYHRVPAVGFRSTRSPSRGISTARQCVSTACRTPGWSACAGARTMWLPTAVSSRMPG